MNYNNAKEYKPKVSVIIPVYNVCDYLAEALESVIKQTYNSIEIIVVDDGSNDGSEKICDEYAKKDNRIKLIHQINGGLSTARNTGLDIANGEYIAFLDSDDIYHPEMIQRMLHSILYNDADCVVCRHIDFDSKQKPKLINAGNNNINGKMYFRNKVLNAIANNEIECCAWDKLYKKNLFQDIRYPIGQNYEDIYTIFDIFDKTEKVFILENKLIFHRKHSQSISSTYSLRNFLDLQKAHDKFEEYVKNHITDIFTDSVLNSIRNRWLNLLLYKYAQILQMNISKKHELLFWLTEQISEEISKNGIEKYSLKTRLICFLFFKSPKIFSICAIPYLFIRKCISICLK